MTSAQSSSRWQGLECLLWRWDRESVLCSSGLSLCMVVPETSCVSAVDGFPDGAWWRMSAVGHVSRLQICAYCRRLFRHEKAMTSWLAEGVQINGRLRFVNWFKSRINQRSFIYSKVEVLGAFGTRALFGDSQMRVPIFSLWPVCL